MRYLFVLALLVPILPLKAQEPTKKLTPEDQAKALVAGTVRESLLPDYAAKQHSIALEFWQKLYAKDEVPTTETTHLLLYGRLPNKKLSDVGALLEAQRSLVLKSLDMQWETPWPGKTAVFFFTDRREALTFCRSALRKRLEDTDQGLYQIEGPLPTIVAGPALSKVDLAPERNAGEQLAAALLYKKTGDHVPSWILHAFGRTSMLRTAGVVELGLERKRAAKMLTSRKVAIREVIQPGLPNDEDVVLKASLIDYLALSGKTQAFLPFLKGFQATEEIPEPNVEQALRAARIELDKLDPLWQTWAKSFK